jgi:hypothetical protein
MKIIPLIMVLLIVSASAQLKPEEAIDKLILVKQEGLLGAAKSTLVSIGTSYLGPKDETIAKMLNFALNTENAVKSQLKSEFCKGAAGDECTAFGELLDVQATITNPDGRIKQEILNYLVKDLNPDAKQNINLAAKLQAFFDSPSSFNGDAAIDQRGSISDFNVDITSLQEIPSELIGKDAKKTYTAEKANIKKENGITTFTLNEGGGISIKNSIASDFLNLKAGSYIKVNEEEMITELAAKLNDDAVLHINDETVAAPKNSLVALKDGIIFVDAGQGNVFTYNGLIFKQLSQDKTSLHEDTFSGNFEYENQLIVKGTIALDESGFLIHKGTIVSSKDFEIATSGKEAALAYECSLINYPSFISPCKNRLIAAGSGMVISLLPGNRYAALTKGGILSYEIISGKVDISGGKVLVSNNVIEKNCNRILAYSNQQITANAGELAPACVPVETIYSRYIIRMDSVCQIIGGDTKCSIMDIPREEKIISDRFI